MANKNTIEKSPKAALVALVGLGFGLGLVGLFYAGLGEKSVGPLVGAPAPSMEFSLSSGERKTLASFRGRVVMLNFWAHWCGPCLEEMPSLKQLESRFAKKDFDLLMAHVGEEKEEALKVASLPSQVLFDFPAGTLSDFGVSGLPHSILLDKQGVVRAEFLGPRDWVSSAILQQIQTLLD
jgi:thiol-disulfide isomerase/thioredoxin